MPCNLYLHALDGPSVIRSDNAPCFVASVFNVFACKWGFRHITKSSGYPQSNGHVERAVSTVKGMWRMSDNKFDAFLAYRTTPLEYTMYSPAELMYGRPVRSMLGRTGTWKRVDYAKYEHDLERYGSAGQA